MTSPTPNMLTIDLSGSACSVALQCMINRKVEVLSTHTNAPKQQAKQVLSEIDRLLKQADISIKDLDVVAYGCGPGSFTGLRLTSSVVQAIGFMSDIKIIPISSLAALAQTAYLERGWKRVVTLLDARKAEVYMAVFQIDKNMTMVVDALGERLMPLGGVCLDGFNDWCFIGDGCEKILPSSGDGFSFTSAGDVNAPNAAAIIPLAMQKWQLNDCISPSDVIPVYLNPFKR